MAGLILLGLIAVGAAYLYTRARGKMKLPVVGKHWTSAIIVVVIVLLIMWASNKGGKP
jgi:hypothetical protein